MDAKDAFGDLRGRIDRSDLLRCSGAIAVGLVLGACRPKQRQNDPVQPASGGTASPAPAKIAASPVQKARELRDKRAYLAAVSALGEDRGPEALALLLEMLALDNQHIVARHQVVERLEQWPAGHEQIAAALAAHLERAFWPKELESIARVVAKWGTPEQSGRYARYFGAQRDFGLMKGAASGMESLVSATTLPILLEALPATPPLPAGRADYEHAKLLLGLMGKGPLPAALPKLTAYLQSNQPPLAGPAAVAVGRIGTTAAVAALESVLNDRKSRVSKNLILQGLWHAPHPRARGRLRDALRSADLGENMEAGAALVVSATPADAALLATALAADKPHLRQLLLGAIQRVLPDGKIALAQTARAALAAGRPRTALCIAEEIGAADVVAQAAPTLAALQQQHPDSARLTQWIGRTKEDLERAFPGLVEGQQSKSSLAGDTLYTSYGPHFLGTPDKTLRFYRDESRKVVRVQVQKECREAVDGVRFGTPGSLAWELHGNTTPKIWSRLEHERRDGDRAFLVTYDLDAKGNVQAIDVRKAAGR